MTNTIEGTKLIIMYDSGMYLRIDKVREGTEEQQTMIRTRYGCTDAWLWWYERRTDVRACDIIRS